jgi:hypothetical protein
MNMNRKLVGVLVGAAMAVGASVAHGQANLGVTVPKINPFDRDQVVNLWRTFAYTTQTADRNVAPNWTGSIANCNPGTTAKGYQQLVANQLNMYRALFGQANVTLDTEEETTIAQAATLPPLADQIIYGHDIPATAKCYSETARRGARTSLIAFNPAVSQPSPVVFFHDPGANNYFVGHRQQLMASELRHMAFGNSIDITKDLPSSVALRTKFGPPSTTEAPFLAWPSAGYFPATLLPISSKRWSFGCPECDAKDATVTVSAGGVTAAATKEPFLAVEPYTNQVVFLLPDSIQSTVKTFAALPPMGQFPPNREWPDVLATDFADYPVDVTVSGMRDPQGGLMADIKYRVTLINPDKVSGKVMPTRRYDGMWTAGATGTGVTINTNTTGSLTARWFTRDTNDNAAWYTLADGRWTSTGSFSGKLYAASASGYTVVGGATLTFSGGTAAQLSYTLAGGAGNVSLTRQLAGPESYVPMTHNYTGEWATSSQATSVLALAQDYRGIDGVWLTQDANGRPAWHRISSPSVVWDTSVVVVWDTRFGVPGSDITNNNAFTASITGAGAVAGDGGRLSFTANRQTLPINYNPSRFFVPDENNAAVEISISATGAVAKFPVAKQSNAVFSQGNASVALSKRGGIDVDGNGKSQLVVRNAIAGQMQVGRLVSNQFQWSTTADPGAGFRVLGAADLAGTGKSDLLFQSTTQGEFGDVTAWQGFSPSSNKFIRSVKLAWDAQTFGDMDGDGKGDIVWRWQGNDADTGVSYIWFTDINSATPVNQVRKRGGAPLSWTLLGAADINSDGAADMVYVSPDNQIRVLMATGSAAAPRTCANYAAGSIPTGFTVLKFGDFTGARRGGDVLIRNPATGEVRLISLVATGIQLPTYTGTPNDRNAACTGAGSSALVPTITTSLGVADASWTYVASGDFNGDGVIDIAWRKSDGNLALWLIPLAGAPTVVLNAGSIPSGFEPIALH